MQLTVLRALFFCIVLSFSPSLLKAQQLELEQGDHISFIGNTMADRMQHDGWLETMIQLRHPQHELVIRNLGFATDTLTTRMRSRDFGSPDKWLTAAGTDVVFMMFGFNESFDGEDGIEKFRRDLLSEIGRLKSQSYNGDSAPAVVMISPIASENLETHNLPDPAEANARIGLYAQAMKQIAAENSIPYVDLFSTSQMLYAASDVPLTINGIHLNETGNRLIAEVIASSLFDEDGFSESDIGYSKGAMEERAEATRAAVLEKNFYWYNFYRTTDGYSIYGGRADLRFIEGQTNRVVMDREMEILDMMTANRDALVHAAANGADYEVDDSNLPPFVPVVTNKPGDGPDGTHLFLSGEEAISRMNVLEGFQVNLFADEAMFPELINPVQMAIDPQGRVWVAAWESYPHWKPRDEMNDKLLILEDTDNDGKADVCKTFASGLHNPTGFEFWGGGVLVSMGPDVLWLQDTDGDEVADKTTRVVMGLDTADTHHTANSFTFGPGGGIYFQEGTFHQTQVESPYGPTRNSNGAVYRFDPRTHEFIAYTPTGYANPHGHVFDRWGQDIIHDGTGSVPFHGAVISGHLDFPNKHGGAPVVYNRRTRPCPATELISSRHFPDEMQEEMLVLNVIGDLGLLRYRITDDGSSFQGEELEPLLLSDDPNFRPVDAEFGPHGELFFTDWQNPVIGHMQHNLRDPSRDQTHGRVYRITHTSRPLVEPDAIAGQPLQKLFELLKSPENRVRHRVRIELSHRDSREVADALHNWIVSLDTASPEYEHNLLEALWVHQQHNMVNSRLLERMLNSEDFRARAAAARVLCYWRDKVDNAAERLVQAADDEHPRVRLEAVRTASYFGTLRGLPALAKAMEKPTDRFIDYVAKETMRAFPDWKNRIADSNLLDSLSDESAAFFLTRLGGGELNSLQLTPAAARHILARGDIEQGLREKAMNFMVEADSSNPIDVLLDAVERIEATGGSSNATNQIVRMISDRSRDELQAGRERLAALATRSSEPRLRQIGLVGLVTADGNVTEALALAGARKESMVDLLSSVSMLPDPTLSRQLYPQMINAIRNASEESVQTAPIARFIRIELPGNGRILTLAEVEVYSSGTNVAPAGSATQSSVGHGGVASRAIDGNTSASWTDGGQTHTSESTNGPWWEVDLGTSRPVETIRIFNRQDGDLGGRLEGFVIKVLDENRNELFASGPGAAPAPMSEYTIGTMSEDARIRLASIDSISLIRGNETETFNALADIIDSDAAAEIPFRAAAVKSIQRVPARFWTAERAGSLATRLLDEVRALPVDQRNSAGAADAIQLTSALAAVLPAEQGAPIRAAIDEIGVQIIRIGTVPHRMAYDRELIVVQAGKPIEIIFENTDMMPHNLVITNPGFMERIGEDAEKMSQNKDAMAQHYVPRSRQILLSSQLIQPGENQRMTFEVPSRPAIYPYVCTYPGHWRRMYGALIVVEDKAAYTADPEGYLAAQKIEIEDELLTLQQRTKTEWSMENFEDTFAGEMEDFYAGRDFRTGSQMFKLASCVSCHKMQGEGYEIGPDLTADLDPEWGPYEILESLIDPSKKIDDKYRSEIFALDTGDIVSGIVTFEDDDIVKVVENPLVANEPRIIETDWIEDRRQSEVSVMPEGLLDNLTREEILDLVAYIVAEGDKDHELFKDSHNH
ncbi:MAG: PVC-type heme-binding CxxCH protein [Planctomycetota bacterium]